MTESKLIDSSNLQLDSSVYLWNENGDNFEIYEMYKVNRKIIINEIGSFNSISGMFLHFFVRCIIA